jgi:hypothetical protein
MILPTTMQMLTFPSRAERGGFVPKPGMEMMARRCFNFNPSQLNHPNRDGV